MATSKNLTPTNQTINIPELSDAPNIAVPADAISKSADAINALDGKIDDNVKSVLNASWNTYPGQSCVRHYHYESGTAASTYTLPENYVDVTVIWYSSGRAIATAIEWATGAGRIPGKMWTNASHDSWQGWKELALKSDFDTLNGRFKNWTGDARVLASSGQIWLAGGQLLTTNSASDASGALALFAKYGSAYRLTPIYKTSNCAFIYNANGVFGVQIDGSYTNVQMFAIRLA